MQCKSNLEMYDFKIHSVFWQLLNEKINTGQKKKTPEGYLSFLFRILMIFNDKMGVKIKFTLEQPSCVWSYQNDKVNSVFD